MENRLRNVDAAIERGRRFFATSQNADGHWRGELEGDALTLSETVLLLAFLGEEESNLAKDCAQALLATQLPEGGWEAYPGAGPDVVNVVKGYFALKLTGEDPASEPLVRARKKALELGGADAVNSFTRFYLAILGQIPFSQTPAIPPQATLIPRWFPINLYSISSWSRTIFVPLSIVSALQPVRELPPEKGIRELFIEAPERWKPLVCPGKKVSKNPFSWDFLFRRGDRTVWFCRKIGFAPFRKAGICKALRWTLDHSANSDGPGAIYPPIVWSLIALKALGFSDDSPEVREQRRQLDALVLRDPETGLVRVQPCQSPVWDTSLTLKSLLATGLKENDPTVERGLSWIRARQIDRSGDWANKVAARPGGWAFEYNNDFYPDNDDTAMALTVLGGAFAENGARPTPKSIDSDENLRRGVEWLFAMQNKDGGWGAFDKDNTNEILCKAPFADHNAMIDPSCADLSGRVLEALGRLGFHLSNETSEKKQKNEINKINEETENDEMNVAAPNSAWSRRFTSQVRRAVEFIRQSQRPDGSWFGRWGTNYIYGTWQAISGLRAVGVPATDSAIRAGANWLLTRRREDGGWGESQDSYRDPKLAGVGETTCSQTAWATMGLIAAGLSDSEAVRSGVDYLTREQRDDGSWRETPFTGTGFPLVYYLKYRYYPIYFSLTALGIYRNSQRAAIRSESRAERNLSQNSISEPAPQSARHSTNDDLNGANADSRVLRFLAPKNVANRIALPTILSFEQARVDRKRSDCRQPVETKRVRPTLSVWRAGGREETKAVDARGCGAKNAEFVLRIFRPENERPKLRVFTG